MALLSFFWYINQWTQWFSMVAIKPIVQAMKYMEMIYLYGLSDVLVDKSSSSLSDVFGSNM